MSKPAKNKPNRPRRDGDKRTWFVVFSLGVVAGCATGVQVLDAKKEPTSLTSGLANTTRANVGNAFGFSVPQRNTVNLDQLLAENGGCPGGMVNIEGKYCIDRHEASVVERMDDGSERPFSPYQSVKGHSVRAVTGAGVVPQGYISGGEAKIACAASGKRLCKMHEWKQACMGPEKNRWGYGDTHVSKRCNDHGRSPMGVLHGFLEARSGKWTPNFMNSPLLNQIEGTVAKTGDHDGCTNEYGVYDMVGNLHEWIDDPNGTFAGGYFQDTTKNNEGCYYKTEAHEFWYHDYSTGFRCCADPM